MKYILIILKVILTTLHLFLQNASVRDIVKGVKKNYYKYI